jgi:type I site-specific restriction endonuclease
MNSIPLAHLNLPDFSFKVRELDNAQQIYDSVRKQYVSLTPEEWVRQNFIRFMVDVYQYPASLLSVEKMVKVNNLSQRADIVVYARDAKPWMIVEVKAHSVNISQDTLFQAARYNQVLNVPYLVLTNGLEHFCLFNTGKELLFLDQLPEFK